MDIKFNDFNINNFEVISIGKQNRNIALQNLIINNKIINYEVEKELIIYDLPVIGIENGLYYVDYKINKHDEMINNISVSSPCIKFEIMLNDNILNFCETDNLYLCLLLYYDVKLRIFYNMDDTIEKFKITYNSYLFPNKIRTELILTNGLYEPIYGEINIKTTL